jgi:hypothetical protein
MRTVVRGSLTLWMFLICAACANNSRPARPSGSRADLIGLEELRKVSWPNAYEVVSSLRPRWLQARGGGSADLIKVIVDDMKVGGVEALRNVPGGDIKFIQYYEPLAATSRWGIGFGQGAIYVSTR